MPHYVVDTDDLVDAGGVVGRASAALTALPSLRTDPGAAAGDLTLARALGALQDTWAVEQAGLADVLGALATGLRGAASVLDGAEQATAAEVASLLAAPARATVLAPPTFRTAV
ncbi:hypothetical protein IF650_02380 [Cellulosimicrobium terreum]|nr:hypothetical protein [Cellulosimicrobium terreum]